MKFGFVLPGGEAIDCANFAEKAEEAGWDGIFVPDQVWGVDAWVTLTAIAMKTKRIRMGTMLTPVSRRRPWKLAGETAAIDRLSKGRLILSVGLGAIDTGFDKFGEELDRKKRAELLDEGLDIITGLWQGQPFNYSGKHYQVKETTFFPPPAPFQKPRIPIWVVGAWPRRKSMQRVVKYDGLLPAKMKSDGSFVKVTSADIRVMKVYVDENRKLKTPFDIILEGETSGEDPHRARAKVKPFEDAGATWWLDSMWSETLLNQKGRRKVLKRIMQGPPYGI